MTRRYIYFDSKVQSAQQAADHCERQGRGGREGRNDGAGLAWITSATEEAFIKTTVMMGDTNTNVWIDGADVDAEGRWVRNVNIIDDSSTSCFVNSRTMMGCTDPLRRGVGAPHPCPLRVGGKLPLLLDADVHAF